MAMEETPVWKLLIRLSAPVMLALLIQSIYNIVDSYFVARYSAEGLAALSIIFPIQLLMTALATGTGAGINILISRMDGAGDTKSQKDIISTGFFLGIMGALIFAAAGTPGIRIYYQISSEQELVREYGIQYAQIIFALSLGMFVEAAGTKMLQAKSDMVLPMCAQVAGAVLNIVLDPFLIFGYCGFPELGVRGAAVATVLGQWLAMAIVMIGFIRRYSPSFGRVTLHNCVRILKAGMPSILLQSLYTVYIVGLNLILKLFSEDAVTVLGIYYKLQTFFFIPLLGLQQVILPLISYNYGAGKMERARSVLRYSIVMSSVIMVENIDNNDFGIVVNIFNSGRDSYDRDYGIPYHCPEFYSCIIRPDIQRLFSGNQQREGKHLYHAPSPGGSACSSGMVPAFCGP